MKTPDFHIRATASWLHKNCKSLDLNEQVQNDELDWSTNLLVNYDADTDTLKCVVVEGRSEYGHVFDPTSAKESPELVKELYKLSLNDDL